MRVKNTTLEAFARYARTYGWRAVLLRWLAPVVLCLVVSHFAARWLGRGEPLALALVVSGFGGAVAGGWILLAERLLPNVREVMWGSVTAEKRVLPGLVRSYAFTLVLYALYWIPASLAAFAIPGQLRVPTSTWFLLYCVGAAISSAFLVLGEAAQRKRLPAVGPVWPGEGDDGLAVPSPESTDVAAMAGIDPLVRRYAVLLGSLGLAVRGVFLFLIAAVVAASVWGLLHDFWAAFGFCLVPGISLGVRFLVERAQRALLAEEFERSWFRSLADIPLRCAVDAIVALPALALVVDFAGGWTDFVGAFAVAFLATAFPAEVVVCLGRKIWKRERLARWFPDSKPFLR